LHPASEEGIRLKGRHRDSGIYFKINIAGEEKIATFAARFGRTGERFKNGVLKSKKGKERLKKIKFILFVISEKILTFALPTERKWENRNGGCRKGNRKRLR